MTNWLCVCNSKIWRSSQVSSHLTDTYRHDSPSVVLNVSELLGLDLGKFPKIRAYLSRLRSRASVQRAYRHFEGQPVAEEASK